MFSTSIKEAPREVRIALAQIEYRLAVLQYETPKLRADTRFVVREYMLEILAKYQQIVDDITFDA